MKFILNFCKNKCSTKRSQIQCIKRIKRHCIVKRLFHHCMREIEHVDLNVIYEFLCKSNNFQLDNFHFFRTIFSTLIRFLFRLLQFDTCSLFQFFPLIRFDLSESIIIKKNNCFSLFRFLLSDSIFFLIL